MNICRSSDDAFVKMHLKMRDSDLWRDSNALLVFLRMLQMAHWKNDFTSIRFAGKQYKLQAGEFSASMAELALYMHMPESTLRKAVNRLETDKRLVKRTDRQTTIFSICNWSKYQGTKEPSATNERTNDRSNERTNDRSNVTEGKKILKKEKKEKNNNRDVLGILNKVTGRSFTVEPVGIEKTKSLFTDEEIERALRNMYKDDWHKPMMKKLRPDYLLRATTIDQFKDFKGKNDSYILPGSVIKNQSSTQPQMSRADLLRKEYQNG